MPPLCYKTIFRLSISFCLVFGKTWLYKSIVIARLLCPKIVFKVCGLPPCSMYRVANVSLKACTVKSSIGLPFPSNRASALLIALFTMLLSTILPYTDTNTLFSSLSIEITMLRFFLCFASIPLIVSFNGISLLPDSLFGVPVVLVLSSLNVAVFVTWITFCL